MKLTMPSKCSGCSATLAKNIFFFASSILYFKIIFQLISSKEFGSLVDISISADNSCVNGARHSVVHLDGKFWEIDNLLSVSRGILNIRGLINEFCYLEHLIAKLTTRIFIFSLRFRSLFDIICIKLQYKNE